MTILKFRNNEIFEINGSSKEPFDGDFSPQELADVLVQRWIPYCECRSCGKRDYCKYNNSGLSNCLENEDIQCGIAKKALENFILRTSHEIENDDQQKHQDYLDCVFYFCQYIFLSEIINGAFLDNEKLNHYGSYISHLFADILSIRDAINGFACCITKFPVLCNRQCLLLVEGKSEKLFIDNLKGKGKISNLFLFDVKSYNGKGNKLPKNIKMLIDDYISNGYTVFFQGDEDGSGDGSGFCKFKYFVNSGFTSPKEVFQFKFDLETAIPRIILYQILQENDYLIDKSFDEFNKLPTNLSINKLLKDIYGIDTDQNKLKVKIAKKAGGLLFNYRYNTVNVPSGYEEITKFFKFLRNIK